MTFVQYEGEGPGRVVVFYSGSASSFRAMVKDHNRVANGGRLYEVVFGITNVPDASGRESFDRASINDYYFDPGRAPNRKAYYQSIMNVLDQLEPDIIALSGWLGKYSLIKGEMLDRYRGRIFNVHPAKLTLLTGPECDRLDVRDLSSPEVASMVKARNLVRKYVGDDAVRDAVFAGEETVASTIFAVDEGKDTGTIVVESEDFLVDREYIDEKMGEGAMAAANEYVDELQNRMKMKGDGPAFIRALELFFTRAVKIGDPEEGIQVLEPHMGASSFREAPYGGVKL